MSKREKLKEWVGTLSEEKTKELMVDCLILLIENETIGFYSETKVPYWDGSGENIDGSESDDDLGF
jgi:hypothetical protein